MISLGVDQSMKATGLCLVRFNREGKCRYIRSATVPTPSYSTMKDAIVAFIGLDAPVVTMAEDAYYGKSVMAHGKAVTSGTWVESVICQYKLGNLFAIIPANVWRAEVWGKGKGRLKRDDAKIYSINFAIKHGLVDPDDNRADAFGLALYGISAYLEVLNENTI